MRDRFVKIVCVLCLLIVSATFVPGPVLSTTLATGPVQETIFMKGKKFYDSGNFSEAARTWETILPDSFYGPVAYILIARTYGRLGRHDLAETKLKEFIRNCKESPYREIAKQALVDALCIQGKAEAREMLAAMTTAADKENRPPLILRSAELGRRLGNLNAAVGQYRKLYLEYPATVEGLKAAEELSRLASLGRIAPPVYSNAEQLARAERLLVKGRFDLAAQSYKALSDRNPSDMGLKLKLARSLYKDRRNKEALNLLTDMSKRKLSENDQVEVLYLLSLVHWRLDRERDFQAACEKLIEKGPVKYKRKALFNLGAHCLEKQELDKAAAYFARVLKTAPSAPARADTLWKIAWIRYWKKQYKEAASAFREARIAAAGNKMGNPSKYWQARSLILAGAPQEGEALLKEIAENSPLDYYGGESARLLKAAGSKVEFRRASARAFPELNLTAEQREHKNIAGAEKLMEKGLPEFALLNLESLPTSMKSSPAVAFLRARAAHAGGQYRLAQDMLAAEFAEFMEKPPEDAPREFIEIAFPRVYFQETVRNASRHAVDPYLVWAVVRQESRYSAFAVSPAGALGLMQVTPAASGLVPKGGKVPAKVIAEILEPRKNIALGTQILAKNLRSFKGSLIPSIAAYNADISKVRQWVMRNAKMKQDEFIESIPYQETRIYVKKVLAGYRAYNQLHLKKDLAGLW